ncbi:MAG: response regulator [Candidatus Sigynarchaeota archaeon]
MEAEADSKDTVLVVDDNKDILDNLFMVLDFNHFNVITASNGKEALEILRKLKKVPDVIVSDIMMPEMDGYELLKAVSAEPDFNQIPFIFLSAKTTVEDIRLGKILGVDDYITKPFQQEDLIAIIKGKIARKKNITQFNDKLRAIIQDGCKERSSSSHGSTFLIHVTWDDKIGPFTRDYYPKLESMPFNVQDIGYQLFNASSAIYGDKFSANAEGILLSLANIQQQAYIFFDSYPDRTTRAGVVLYMLAVIAPCISYLASLNIKKILEELAASIKKKRAITLNIYHERITGILSGISS